MNCGPHPHPALSLKERVAPRLLVLLRTKVSEVGGPGTLAQSIAAVRIGGHISLIGTLTGRSGEVPTAALMVKQASLKGLIVGSRRHQREMVRALDASGLRPIIDRTFGLEALADAFRYEESGKHFGKICVEF